jgi:DNA replication protein DnaC
VTTTTTTTADISTMSLAVMLRSLRMPTIGSEFQALSEKAEREGWTFLQYLHELVSMELNDRAERRRQRRLKDAHLPQGKRLQDMDLERLPANVRRLLPTLCTGDFTRQATNVLAFGLPGRGKTHLLAAIGYELIDRGYRVLFTPTYKLVQKLLAAKREFLLERELRRLDKFDAIILDDIGYIQQNRDEMEVLFTFFAERYERRSILISSNLIFSQWDRIFKDPMTTAAAIDRVVHHSVVLELPGPSYRADVAINNKHTSASPHTKPNNREITPDQASTTGEK